MPESAAPDANAPVAAYLAERRKAKGLSQVELARRLSRPQQFISYVETNERRLDLVEFREYVVALGDDPTDAATEVFRRLQAAEPRKTAR